MLKVFVQFLSEKLFSKGACKRTAIRGINEIQAEAERVFSHVEEMAQRFNFQHEPKHESSVKVESQHKGKEDFNKKCIGYEILKQLRESFDMRPTIVSFSD